MFTTSLPSGSMKIVRITISTYSTSFLIALILEFDQLEFRNLTGDITDYHI